MNTKMLVGWILAIGAINWGLTAVGYNVVEMIFGTGTITKFIYIIVGLAGVYKVYMLSTGGYKKKK